MTCREKLAIEHPKEVSLGYVGGCFGCPSMYNYLDIPEYCDGGIHASVAMCTKCWDREIPGTGETPKVTTPPKQFQIPLSNGYYLKVEQNPDPHYPFEVFIEVLDKENNWVQDLVLARQAYSYDKDLNVIVKDDKFEVLVWGKENDEDYTEEFEIGLYKEEVQDNGDI